MADSFINVELSEDLALPYESGAEQWLEGWLAEAWAELALAFPDIRLDPLFSYDPFALADLVDIGAMLGGAPPDPFAWFEIPCAEETVEALLPLVAALPFVKDAERRLRAVPASIVSYGTNPESMGSLSLEATPNGVDALYAWDIAGGTGGGVRFCDIEGGWGLDHEDLLGADIQRFSTFGSEDEDHGTSVLGIVMGQDNGVGIVGIAPDVTALLVTVNRGVGTHGAISIPSAFAAAGIAAGPLGVVLIELELILGENAEACVPVEFERATQTAIRILTDAGITVIEPAGNGTIDLDARADCAHLRPESPTNSGAVMVGGGVLADDDTDTIWTAGSTRGSRVDCFAPYQAIRAPSSVSFDDYRFFGGTSGASAIIAGVACALQSLSETASGVRLLPSDIRRLLSDPALGTPTGPGQTAGVGAMPDMRQIAQHMGWPRIVPLSALAFSEDGVLLIQVDDDDHLNPRMWTSLTGLVSLPIEFGDGASFPIPGQTSAALTTWRHDPVAFPTFEVLAATGIGEIRRLAWGLIDPIDDLSISHSAPLVVAPGRDLAAVRPREHILAVAGISSAGQLVVMFEDDTAPGQSGLTDPLVLDTFDTYRRLPGPILFSRAPGDLDLVAIDDAGLLRYTSGSVDAGWEPVRTIPSEVDLEPRAKLAAAGTPDGFAVVAVGTDRRLYASGIGLAPVMFEEPLPVGGVHFAAQGPLALIVTEGNQLLTAGVGADGLIYWAERSLRFPGRWSALLPVDRNFRVSPLGGAVLVAFGSHVTVFAVTLEGQPCRSNRSDKKIWSPLRVS